MSKARSWHHVVALDGLRGAAILSVLCFHFFVDGSYFPSGIGKFLLPFAKMGWMGVDLFFVLSGFLITGILLNAHSATNYYQVFYARRLLRIFPVYYLAVALVFWVLVPLGRHAGFFHLHPIGSFGHHEQLWYWVNLSNLRTAFYPLLIPMISPFWSLAIEEQFYLLWPALVRNLRQQSLMVFCLAGMVISAALRNLPWIQHWNEVYSNLIYRFTPLHVDGLLFGAVLAMMLLRYGGREGLRKPFVALFWVTAAALVFLARTPYPNFALMTRVGYSVLALFAGSLIWLCVAPFGSSLARRIFSSRPLVLLGKYSYFIYVFHMLFFYYVCILAAHFIHGRGIAHPYLTRILMGCVTFVLTYLAAVISWKIFEGPILNNKRHFIYRYPPRDDPDSTHAMQQANANHVSVPNI
jgi:peptidoglycan/LPS O-acetylase OafA/YrhL